LRSCPRFELVSVNHSPEEGPDVITIDKIKAVNDVYTPVVFSHRLHAEMSGMAGGCEMCHHYNPPGQVVGCDECHSLTRVRKDVSKPDLKGAFHRQCMNCHRSWSGKVECESCHPLNNGKKITKKEIKALSAKKRVHPEIKEPDVLTFDTGYDEGNVVTFYHKEHTNLFGQNCQSCHTDESCIKCHAANESIKAETKSLVEGHDLCSKCHDTDDNCSFCHDTKMKKPFNHETRTGFTLNKFHKKLMCQTCHTKKGKFTGLAPKCVNCHGEWNSDNFDHKVTGIILNETHKYFECENCHTEENYINPSCDNCHDEDIKYPDKIPGRRI
jgi:hypothetical protein